MICTYHGNPAQLQPHPTLGFNDLCVVTTGTHIRCAITLLFDLIRAAEYNRDKEAKVLILSATILVVLPHHRYFMQEVNSIKAHIGAAKQVHNMRKDKL